MDNRLWRFQIFLDEHLAAVSLGVALALLALPAVIFVHELGHAVAVKLRGLPLRQLTVGTQADLIVTIGGFRMELGRLWGKGDVGGYVRYDGRDATPHDAFVIALAGPLANLGGALVTGWLALRCSGAPWLLAMLVMLTLSGVEMALASLRPRTMAGDPTRWSDGMWMRVAWRERHRRGPVWRDPHEATSIPPPAPAG